MHRIFASRFGAESCKCSALPNLQTSVLLRVCCFSWKVPLGWYWCDGALSGDCYFKRALLTAVFYSSSERLRLQRVVRVHSWLHYFLLVCHDHLPCALQHQREQIPKRASTGVILRLFKDVIPPVCFWMQLSSRSGCLATAPAQSPPMIVCSKVVIFPSSLVSYWLSWGSQAIKQKEAALGRKLACSTPFHHVYLLLLVCNSS